MFCHLENEVPGSPKSGQTKILSIFEASQPERSVTNRPGAQKRSRLRIAEIARDGKGKTFWNCNILGISAIDVSARSFEVLAQVFVTRSAEFAYSASRVNPGDADPISNSKCVGSLSGCFDTANYLMTKNNRQM